MDTWIELYTFMLCLSCKHTRTETHMQKNLSHYRTQPNPPAPKLKSSKQYLNSGLISSAPETTNSQVGGGGLKCTHPVLEAPWVLGWCQENGRRPRSRWPRQDCGCPGRSRSRTRLSPTLEVLGLTETPEEPDQTLIQTTGRSLQTELLYTRWRLWQRRYSRSSTDPRLLLSTRRHVLGQNSRVELCAM